MSWNNVIPAWMLFEDMAKREAMSLCAMPEEWNAGISLEVSEHLWEIDKACMSSYEKGGWNYEAS